jgi:translation elongation factor aEF-1 beta
MAKVLVSLKIFPSDINVDREKLKKSITENLPKFASIHSFEEEPIAFGLVALRTHILIPEEKAGGIDEVETILKNLESISDIQTIMVRRL